MTNVPVPIDQSQAHVDSSTGKPHKDFFNWITQVSSFLNGQVVKFVSMALSGYLTADSIVVGSPTGGNKGSGSVNSTTLYENGNEVFAQGANATKGITITTHDLGTISSGTVTPDPLNGLKQKLSNNGAFTLSPSTAADGDVELLITNAASAGAVTFSGFTKAFAGGDTLDTTNGNKFLVFIYVINGSSAYIAKALQ